MKYGVEIKEKEMDNIFEVVRPIFKTHNVRVVGLHSTFDEFGDHIIGINAHYMDLYHCDFEKLWEELEAATNLRIGYCPEDNTILMKKK